jgi:hypothetical protein
MLNKNTTNNENHQYYSIVIGDILLHSERKSTPIQVISQSFVTNSQTIEKLNIPRVILNSSGLIKDQSRILCDLKNSTIVPLKSERILSTGKFVRLHQAGWAFVKELKSKVFILNTNTNNKQTHF